ncbi:MAG TPA: hypothetical protein VF245_12655 [Solirubrobacterales bacterium]
MAESKRQRRKRRQQEREAGGVAPELREEADAPAMPGDEEAEQVTVTGPGDQGERTFAEAEAETFEEPSYAALIGALGPLRRTRRHSLLPGIRMFTALLEEARGGYAADRLGQLAEALAIDFNPLETDGILQVAMAEMDETGVPDVEHAVRLCLEARAQIEGQELAEPGEDDELLDEIEDEPLPPAAEEEEVADEVEPPAAGEYVPQSEEAKRLAATGAPEVDVKAMDAQVAEREAADRETAEPDEDPDPDAPGPDER